MPTINLVLQVLLNLISSRVHKKEATSEKGIGILFLCCLLWKQATCKVACAQLLCVHSFLFCLISIL